MRRTSPARSIGTALFCAAFAAALALVAQPAEAAVPTSLTVTGALQAIGGGPAADGTYYLTFSLYDAPAKGKAVWSEPNVKVLVSGGHFSQDIGVNTPLKPEVLAGLKTAWLGVAVSPDPELPRQRLRSVAYALRAASVDGLQCTGCVKAEHLAPGSITADKVGFTYAGAKTKGGPAETALDLQCTGCVTVAEMKFDQDLDLGGNGLKVKKVQAETVAANTVTATSFAGDGSKLTGLKTPAGTCKVKGEVVKGIAADGTLICVPSMDPANLPPDGIDEISNGLIANQFVDEMKISKAVPIKDNDPTGVSSTLVMPDIGLAQKLDVWFDISNSDVSKVTVWLFDAANTKYVLYDKGGKGTSIKGTFPSKDKPVKGDLAAWAGKNPKGTWRLQVLDTGFKNNANDGQINGWGIQLQTLSNKKIQVKGKLLVNDGFRLPVAAKEPEACDAANLGFMWVDQSSKSLKICNGKKWFTLNLVSPDGSKSNPALSCKAIADAYPSLKTGDYWLDNDGAKGVAPPYQAHCDMDIQGGGWTLAMNVNPADGNVVSFTNKKFWQSDAEFGTYSNHFTKDYKGPAAWQLVADDIMVQTAEPGANGNIIGWKAWRMTAKTFDSFFHSPDNTTQTSSVLGSQVAGVYAYEAVIRNGTHLQSNRKINPNGDRVRLGVNGYSKQGDDNQPGLGTQMNENSCGVGNNCYRYKDVELWVNSSSNLWCSGPGNGSYAWIGTDGGCGGKCGNCDSKAGPPYKPHWTYRIYVR